MYATIRLPEDWTPKIIGEILGEGFYIGPARTLEIVFFDTFDWRLATAEARLWREFAAGRRVLHWLPNVLQPTYTMPIDDDPTGADGLPAGFLKSQLAPLLGLRALTNVGSCRLRRYVAAARDGHGTNTVHVHLERVRILTQWGKPTGSPLSLARVAGLPGCERVFDHTVNRLVSLHPQGGKTADLLELTVAARGRTVGDYSSKFRFTLNADQPSESALRAIHLELLRKLLANVDGTVTDLDIEFLHDLRVACRRTRSALTKVKGVFPKDRIVPFATEFKWLGEVTGPCRDLDVQLRDAGRHRRAHPDLGESLEPLFQVIEEARNRAHEDVSAALRSTRFEDLIRNWEAFLQSPAIGDRTTRASRPIRDTASDQIVKAHRRMVKRGKRLGENPSAGTMHRLRIDAKNLRYLLEFFRSLYAQQNVDRLVKELKTVQDALGTFNDMEVQHNRLREFTRELLATREIEMTTLSAVKHMAAACKRRQEKARRNFRGQFEAFVSPKSRARYTSLFESEV